jgi:ketosteroid isomerase-like protein
MEQYDLLTEEGVVQDVRVSGDLGFARGMDTGTASPKDGGDPIEVNTKWVAIYERQADGSWLCICEIGNSNL